jgi:hypothetical protein
MRIVIVAGSSNRFMRAEAWGYTPVNRCAIFNPFFLLCSPRYIIHFFAFFINPENPSAR